MEKNVKVPFFIKVKKAITDFEYYANFAIEKTSSAFKYCAKLIIICAIILAIALSYKVSQIIQNEEELEILYNQVQNNTVERR